MSAKCHFCNKLIADVTSNSVLLVPFDNRNGRICFDEDSHYATFWPSNPFAHRRCYKNAKEEERRDRHKHLEPKMNEYKKLIRRVMRSSKPSFDDVIAIKQLYSDSNNDAAQSALYEELGGAGWACKLRSKIGNLY